MGEGMPLGAECALRARRLAASDPYQPADPRQGRQVYRAGGVGIRNEPGTRAPLGGWEPGVVGQGQTDRLRDGLPER